MKSFVHCEDKVSKKTLTYILEVAASAPPGKMIHFETTVLQLQLDLEN